MVGVITEKTRVKRGVNANSLKNLRPFQKGNHASPGRPKKGDCLLSCIKSELAKRPFKGSPTTNDELIASCLVSQASLGNLKAIELLMSYTTVKPTQSVDVTTKGESIGNGHIDIPEQHFADALIILAKSGVSQN